MSRLTSALLNLGLIVCSVVLVLMALEGFLWAHAAIYTPPPPPPVAAVPAPIAELGGDIVVPPAILAAAKQRQDVISMPESWKRTPTQVSGAYYADFWHGVLEVKTPEGMRWATPFPPRQEDVYRVMVVGDSLTYGDGLAEEWRFSNLLTQWLQRDLKIEFLNLGIDGYNSEDVLNITKRYLPVLRPNLVFYAICVNDFLPSGGGQYNYQNSYAFPLPDRWKNFIIVHTRTGAFLSEIYDGALRRLHLRSDFFDDILADFGGYQQRFARDVAEMNRSIRNAGLPPLVAMVVDQYPYYAWQGYKLAKIAESALEKAGAEVIPTENYYRRYHAQPMHISRWEGHPNEVANYIWASMIARQLHDRADLTAFKR